MYTNFTSLDLSSNKLTGTLIDTFKCPRQSLNVSVNRLSGEPPTSIRNTSVTVNALDGNLLGCPILTNDVIDIDDSASCGSSNLEYPFYAWLVLLVTAIVLLTTLKFFGMSQKLGQITTEWWVTSHRYLPRHVTNDNTSTLSSLYHTKSAVDNYEAVISMSLLLTILYVFVVMMTYIGIKLCNHNDVVYQVQYLYTTTSVYFIGSTPTGIVWFYVTISGAVVIVMSVASRPSPLLSAISNSKDTHRIESNDDEAILCQDFGSFSRAAIVAITVVGVAFAINYGFVRIVYFDKPPHLPFIQFSFAIIKNIFSSFIVPYSSSTVPKSSRQLYSVVMTIIVNVFAPGVAVLMTSPLCLLNDLKKVSISVPYKYPQFTIKYTKDQMFFILRSASAIITFQPPWFYSYQCSSAFITSYLPNFIYQYTINGFVSPLLNLAAMFFLSVDYENRIEGLNVVTQYFLGTDVDNIFYMSRDKTEVMATEMELTVSPSRTSERKKEATTGATSTTVVESYEKKKKTYELKPFLMQSLCVDITLLLTFGLASPLLAIVITFSIVVNVVSMRLALGRYISVVVEALDEKTCCELLERAFEDEWGCLSESWWVISIIVGLFWSLVVNDTVGDRNPKGGIVAAVMMMLWCPIVFIAAQHLLTHHSNYNSNSYVNSIRDRVERASQYVHSVIWRHLDRRYPAHDNNHDSISITQEIISPLRSLNK